MAILSCASMVNEGSSYPGGFTAEEMFSSGTVNSALYEEMLLRLGGL